MKVQTYEQVYGKSLTIRDLVNGFDEDTKTGRVRAFDGNLNVRPEYQREFIYDKESQQEVIKTIVNGYPLNVMYWAKSPVGADAEYEVMDGQQRILSICKFYDTQQVYPVEENGKTRNLTWEDFEDDVELANKFLDYPLMVYICDGSEREKMKWFQVINKVGVKLTEQEMLNAIYTSSWVTDAKRYFSNPKGEGYLSDGHVSNGHTYGEYVNVIGGNLNDKTENENAIVRQKLLEIVLGWATDKYNRENGLTGKSKIDIEEFMRLNKGKPNALELWRYYEDVMEWVKSTFPTYRVLMKNVEWGLLYNEFHDNTPADADDKVNMIWQTAEEISNPKEMYHAVLSGDMKWLNARKFSETDKKWAYHQQGGRCPYCHKEFDIKQMHGDHIIPWSKGGKTDRDNLQMLCTACNLKKSAYDVVYTPWDNEDYESFDIEKWDEYEVADWD